MGGITLVLEEKYFLVVYGSFERAPIEFDRHPSEEEVIQAIKDLDGKSAIVEKRYVLKSKERVSV